MRPPDLAAALAALQSAEPDLMERDDLVDLTRQITSVRAWCDALQVRSTRRLRALADAGHAEAPRDVLGREGRQSSKHARTADEREQVCTSLPAFEDALGIGAVAAGHLDAIASATRGLDDQQRAEFAHHATALLADAQHQSVDAFERNCRDVARSVTTTRPGTTPEDELAAQRARAHVKHWTDRETGMAHTHLELDPVSDRTLWTAVRAALAKLRAADGNRRTPWQRLEVDAVITAIGGGSDRVPEIVVIVDDRTRCHGTHADTICETSDGLPLPVSTVHRLCCDAEITIAHLDGNREVLDLGRSQRTASRAQRRAIKAMHRTCIYPGCTVTVDDCRIHHTIYWRNAGRTDLADLAPVCERHHHLVHEGGWTLTLTAGRNATWTRPDGVVHHTGPTIDRTTARSTAATGGRPRPSAVA